MAAGSLSRPDPDEDEALFEDRSVRLEGTCDGAAALRGDLSPECAAAIRAVLESLGKKRGAEDDRSEAQRYHDALQEAGRSAGHRGLGPAASCVA